MAWVILGESLTLREALGVAFVVLAVYLTHARPSGEPLHGGRASMGILAGLASTIVFASTAIIVRSASAYIRSLQTIAK
jgi:drug/metabolite transporter (DMT)-like permease